MSTSDDPPGPDGAPAAPPGWFKAALESMLDLVGIRRAVRDDAGEIVDFEVVYTNAPSIGADEVAEERPVGSRLTELDPSVGDLVRQYATVVETGVPLTMDDFRFEHVVDGETVVRWYAVQVSKFGDGVIMVSRDITGAMEERRRIEALNRQLSAAQRLAHVGLFTVDLASDDIWFSDELRAIFGIDPDQVLPSRDQLVRAAFDPAERDVIDAAQRRLEATGEPVAFETNLTRPDGSRRDLLIHLEAVDPARGDSVILGTAQDVTALRATERERDDAEERLESQRALIDQFQAATLAPVPEVEGVRLESAYYPATRDERFGGDWYDAFVLDDDTVMVAVGDVAGHGIEAVAAMAQFRNALRAFAFEARQPAATLDRLSAFAAASDVEDFATVCCATYRLRTRTFTWAHAGHPPPALVVGTTSTILERAGRPPIGVPFPSSTPQHEIVLAPDATMVLYTDGLIERRGASIDDGLGRLERALATLAPRTGPICRRLRDALVAGTSDDDICLLALRTGPARADEGADSSPRADQRSSRAVAAFECDAAAVRAARRFVIDEAQPTGLDAEMVALLVSELAANAVLHARTPFSVAVDNDDAVVRVAVTDGRSTPPVMKSHSPAAVTGRGLRLIDSVAERWGVDQQGTGKTVWFEYLLTEEPA